MLCVVRCACGGTIETHSPSTIYFFKFQLKSRSGKQRGATTVQEYNAMATHWDAIFTHICALPVELETYTAVPLPDGARDPVPVPFTTDGSDPVPQLVNSIAMYRAPAAMTI